MPGNPSSSKHARPTGVTKHGMTTRSRAKDDGELQKKLRDIQLKKDALEQQVEQAQARAGGENGTRHDQNSAELKDLLNQLDEAQREEARLSAQRGLPGQEPDGSEMDVDPAVPNFAQTRDENLPTNEGDAVVKSEDTEETAELSQAGVSTTPQAAGTASPPTQSTEPQGQPGQVPVIEVDNDDDDDVLVDMQSLSISADGVADAWFRTRQGSKAIVRLGPKRYPRYEVRPGKGYSTAGLQEVSDAESRIPCIMTRDGTGRKRRLYGIENIAGFDGVATVGNGVVTSYLRAPTTYVKIKWMNLEPEHARLCGRSGKNWATRSDLIAMIGKELADKKIRQLWDIQEKRHAEWQNGQMGRRSVDRSPTPFPLDVYEEIRKARGSVAPEVQRGPTVNPTVKREEDSLFVPGPDRKEETPLASGAQTSSPSPPPAASSPAPGAAEAMVASGSTAPNHGQDGSGNSSAANQTPKTFSERQYLENMKQDLDLESVRNRDFGEYVEQMAIVRAKFDAYRGEMERQGYVLVH